MSGALPLLSLYASIARTGKTIFFYMLDLRPSCLYEQCFWHCLKKALCLRTAEGQTPTGVTKIKLTERLTKLGVEVTDCFATCSLSAK